jgi:hypothetical protein
MSTFVETCLSFAINFAIVVVIVRFVYYPQRRDKDYVFTFVAFNTIIFFVMGLLNNSNISVGVGFGLFAIFSVLRYRTNTVPIREMTYLFVLIALPVLNSILLEGEDYAEFAAVNIATIAVLFVLEKGWGFEYEIRKSIMYERIELIRPENWCLLQQDLQERTGLPIKRIEIGRLNFLRDSAEINVYYDKRKLDTAYVKVVSNHHNTFTENEALDD